MGTGMGATQYKDLNSDLLVCISQVPSHIQTVTGLADQQHAELSQIETCDLIHHIPNV